VTVVPGGHGDRAALLEALGQEMRKVSAQSVLLSQTVADRVGIHPTDLECLDILNWTGPVTAGRLAELTGLTTGAITGVVDRLERAGFAFRERDVHDRRKVIIQLSPSRDAERMIGPLYASLARRMDELFGGYSDAQLALILDFATRSNAIALEEITRLRDEAPKRGAEPRHDTG
jgi:DNA-binding MarR family transcriptional regulator